MLHPSFTKRLAILQLLLIIVISSFSQAPTISYSNSTLNLFAHKPMNSITAVNTGGIIPANSYGQVSTLNLPFYTTQGYLGIDGPVGIAYDNSNTIYNGTLVVADMWKDRIVRINLQANTYTVLAGNGGAGYANGDGVTQAQFKKPSGVLVANNGDIYVADKENHMIRKMTLQPNGTFIVSKLAGHNYTWLGFTNPGNENGTGVDAGFRDPESLAFDLNGNIIVADRSNHLIRKVTTAGVVTTIAGDGYKDLFGNGRFADNSSPLSASFKNPTDIAIASNGDIYVADRNNDRIRKITYNSANQTYGAVTTFAGANYGFYDATGVFAAFNKPYGIDIDASGNLYVADEVNNRIRKISNSAVVTTLAGSGSASSADGTGSLATFNTPLGICTDGVGSVFISDYYGDKIRKLSLTGYMISPSLPEGLTFDGTIGQVSGTATVGSPATNYTVSAYNLSGTSNTNLNITVNTVAATLTYESPKVFGANTNITPLVPTITNGVIRNSATASPTTDYTIVKTFTTNVAAAYGMTQDPNGNIYVGDYQGDIYKITQAGVKTLFKSGMGYIYALSSDMSGNIYVTGRYLNGNGLSYSQVKKITSAGVATTIAGTNDVIQGYPDYNTTNPFSVQMNPVALTISDDGYRYIAETDRIFRVDAQGIFRFFAGATNSTYTPSYNDGLGATARFKYITALAIDKSGNIYVADDAKVRKITSAGLVTTIADYTAVTKVVSGVTTTIRLNGIAVDYENNVYASTSFHTIYKITPNGTSSIYAGSGNPGDLDIPNGPLYTPFALKMDDNLNLYVYNMDISKVKIVRPNGIYVKPSLPNGLSLNKYTGAISGTPAQATPATTYVFIAHNDFAFSTTTSNITIAGAPSLTTSVAASITPSTAILGGNITDNGGSIMIERGLVWSTTGTPTITDFKQAQSNNALGSFTASIRNLTAATTYYVRAYITTAIGTTYGNQITFTTPSPSLPTLTLSIAGSLMNVTSSNADFVSAVTNDGGVSLSARGVCWSTTASPTVLHNITTDGILTGTVTSTLSNLQPNTRYFLRAYATNSVGTQYGNEIVFTTNGIAPNISYPSTISLRKDVVSSIIQPTNTGGIVGNGIYGKISIFAGVNIGNLDGIGLDAKFQEPVLLAVDQINNNIYVADKWANRIRKVTPDATVTTVAGNGMPLSSDNSNPLSASFSMPTGVIYDPYGNLYIGDKYSSKIRKITPNGVVSTFAGSGSNYLVDGTGIAASFSQQNQIAMDIAGNIYVADQSNHAIRKISTTGVVTTLAGNGSSGSTDGTGSAARFNYPFGIAVDRSGNVFVADRSNHKIRKITPTGVVTTFAGTGVSGFADGAGTTAKFYNPHGLTFDAAGNLYVVDANNYKIRKITPTGEVSTIAGTGNFGWLQGDLPGVDYLGSSSSLASITGIVFDQTGSLFIAEAPRVLKMSTVGYAISPALPNGLTLNAQGQITGTPTVISSATNYTISATNAFGTSSSTISLEVVDASPSGLDYSTLNRVNNIRTLVATNGTTISAIVPSSTGGAITSYSVSPSLPAGLTINSSNGGISGKPSVASSLSSYTVTASNAISATTTILNIEVIDAAPANLSYAASTLVANNGSPVTNVSPTSTGGVVNLYTVIPALPSGLTLNASTGVISGTPNSTSPLTTYTIIAGNNIGTVTSTISIEVTADAPVINFNNAPYIFTKNTSIQQIEPIITTTGSASFSIGTVSFAINPVQLPTGLTFNTSTGSITGTPTTIVASSTYTISATIGSSTNYANLTIAINDIAPAQLVYSSPSINASVGTAISTVTPSNSGGVVTSYSISPNLPAGLSFNTSTGEISGTPASSSGSNDYIVSATNSGGTISNTITLIVNEAIPTNFTYNTNALTYTNGTLISSISPTITGNVNNYSISPSLPNGLNFNTSTGAITGTPTSPSNSTVYLLSATNSGGSVTYSITITVNDIAPTNLVFSNNTISATNGSYLVPITPSNSGGAIVNYTINPSLPAGLNFDLTTGVISGIPAAPSPSTIYTISGINSGGTITSTITLDVADAPPVGFVYANSTIVANTGTTINNIVPSSGGGAIVSYAISPVLPNGLNFNTITGVISGTPTESIANTIFTIVATNAAGSTSTSINITINVLAPTNLTYNNASISLTDGTPITALTPSILGGLVSSFTVIPNLPNGLTLNSTTGVISGTPTGAISPTVYIITATNNSGSATASMTIEVVAATSSTTTILAPANLTYSVNTINAQIGQAITAVTSSQTGGTASYTIQPNLPGGLTLNANSGAISGTPTGSSSSTVYTITATNASGSTTATLTIQVQSSTSTITANLPQGSINAVDRALLASDIVQLKFNFSQGTAPYTVIFSNNHNNIIDTVSNLMNSSIVSLRKLDTTTQFTLISISDINATRTAGFTKDTTLIKVLKPLLVLNLTASNPVKQNNGSFLLKLNMIIKNIGDVFLNNVQVIANLKNIFGNGYTFNLKNVAVTSGLASINPNYTGMGELSTTNGIVFQQSVGQVRNIKSFATSSENNLFTNGTNLSTNEENTVEFQIEVVPNMNAAPLHLQFASAGAAVVEKADGTSSTQLALASSNDATSISTHPNVTGVGAPLPTTVAFAPIAPIVSNKAFILKNQGIPTKLIDLIQSYPIGSTIAWCVTSNNNLVCDTIAPVFPTTVGQYNYIVRSYDRISTLSSDTVGFSVQLLNKADLMQVQQIIGAPILQENSTYNIPITIIVENISKQQIDSVLLTNNLRAILPAIIDFNIVSVSMNGILVRNLLYNGDSQIGITTIGSKINPGETVTIQLVININPKGYVGSIPSITNVTAKTFAGIVSYDASPITNNTGTPSTILIPELSIKIPEVFTPNRDGVNDRFVIIKPYGVRIDLEVYNRWGTKVFTRNNYQNDWDGRGDNAFSGQDLVDGGYYYTIKALNNNGTTQILKGFIIIQR